MNTYGGRALFGLGGHPDLPTHANSEYRRVLSGRHTAGANVRRGEGNNPDRQLRSQSYGSVGNDVGRHRQLGGWLRSSHPLKKA